MYVSSPDSGINIDLPMFHIGAQAVVYAREAVVVGVVGVQTLVVGVDRLV